MSNIPIKGIPGFDGIDFEFDAPQITDPTKPFPAGEFKNGEFSVTKIKASASASFPPGDPAKGIQFQGKVQGGGALGVYQTPENLLNALKGEGVDEPIANLLDLKIGADQNLLALRWGFGFEASVAGKVAFPAAPGLNLNVAASGKKTGLSVLLHYQKRTDSVTDSIKDTLKSWRIPSQIKTIDDANPKDSLAAGTTVLYETLGKLDLSLGVEYGYDYSWSRDAVKIGNLSADLKLKIEAAIKAQLGFSATSLYCLALSRPTTEPNLRFQVFRLREKGMSFAFNAGISEQFDPGILADKKNFESFIKGVFNLDGSQVFKDIEKILDKDTDLSDFISQFLTDYVEKVSAKFPALAKIEAFLPKFKELVEKWHTLPHEITAQLYGFLQQGADLTKLKDVLAKITQFAQNPDSLVDELTKHIEDVNFYGTPVGKWLSALAGLNLLPGDFKGGISTLLANLHLSDERAKLVDLAGKTQQLLDGDVIEHLLTEFQKTIDSQLNLDDIIKKVPTDWKGWLRDRISKFLGDDTTIEKDLDKIRATINKLRDQTNEFYQKGLEALKAKYAAEINFTFEKTSHSDALIDFTLDFSANHKKDSEEFLAKALDGDFSGLFNKSGTTLDFLKLNKAAFTHEIKRNTHLGVSLPHFTAYRDHVTTSKVSVENNGDKLWVFTLDAEDLLIKKRAISKLSIEAKLNESDTDSPDSAEIRTFSKDTYKTTYKFSYGIDKVDRRYVLMRFDPAVAEYLKTKIPSYQTYLDNAAQALGIDANGKFKNILTSLEISLPGDVITSWRKIPLDLNDTFLKNLSETIQTRLRQWIPAVFIQDGDEFDKKDKIDMLYPLLVYQALPIQQTPLVDDDDVFNVKDVHYFHWDFKKKANRESVFTEARTKLLGEILPEVQKLTTNPAYASSDANLKAMLKSMNDSNFETLCKFEKKIIQITTVTIMKLIDYLKTPLNSPEEKIVALTEFGKVFTETFNEQLGHIKFTPKGALRPAGLILIKDIAKLADPNSTDAGLTAILETSVLKSAAAFKNAKKDFLEKDISPKLDDTLLQQRIVEVRN
jgi:hypothetical protein